MKLAITGATGGIGRSLVDRLKQTHEVTGIVRHERPDDADVRYVASGDPVRFAAALGEADVVIHNALDSRARGRDFLPANEKLNREVLAGALAGRCRLYVYVSSQVVYSGIEPAGPQGYDEDQELVLTDRLDDYTRLKIEEERRVVAACAKAGIGYLIVRPTVVTGPGMAWSDGVVAASRLVAFGIGGRTMNLVHVEDLARYVEALLARGVRNSIVNLGTENFASETYFRQVGAICRRPVLFVPAAVMRLVGKLLPSTMWFFARNVAIDSRKVQRLTGIAPHRTIADYFTPLPRLIEGDTLEALKAVQRGGRPFRAEGQGYSRWFNPIHGEDRVALRGYRGIVGFDGERITVKAGTRLSEIVDYLDQRDRVLPTLPEFSGVSAGACFFSDIHGSSNAHFSVYDLIAAIGYLDEAGNEVHAERDEALWAELRTRQRNFILTEVTFRTEPGGWLGNRIAWHDDADLVPYLRDRHRENDATTLHWYPRYRKVLIYHINRVAGPEHGAAPSVAPFRGLPYRAQQLMLRLRLRGRALQIDRQNRILAPWRTVPLEKIVGWLLTRPNHAWRDLEFCVSISDAIALIEELQAMVARGAVAFSRRMGIGMRFSYRQPRNEGFVWMELVSDDPAFVEQLIGIAHRLARDGLAFHGGKYRPR